MKQSWQIIRYYYTWQPVIPVVVVLGVFLFILKTVFTNTNPQVTFVLGMGSFAFLFVIPFCSSSTALRHLAANPHTTMVPGFRLQAGIAHLLLTIAASVYLYVNFLVFAPDDYSPLVMVRTFICLSAYAGFMQLILPSRYFVSIISLAPALMVMIVIQFRDLAATLFLNTNFTLALLVAAFTGWAFGLHTLATDHRFRAANTALNNTEAWASYDGGFLTRMAIGRSRTAEGTLLLGYPDNWWGIGLRVVYYFILTPMFTTGFMFLIGITEKWDASITDALFRLFLILSLFSGLFCIFFHGELAARARLVWLRHGTDRSALWQLVDSYCLRFLVLYYLCGAFIALMALLFSDIERVYLLHYLLVIFSFCCFNLYLSLLVRASMLPSIVLILAAIISMVCLFGGFVRGVWHAQPSFLYLSAFEAIFMTLGIIFRYRVKQLFSGIDWKLVSLNKVPGKLVQTRNES